MVLRQTWRKARKKPVIIEFREVVEPFEDIITLETPSEEHALRAYPDRDYIIRGVEGEIYPIKKTIFHETYEILGAYHDVEEFYKDKEVIENE